MKNKSFNKLVAGVLLASLMVTQVNIQVTATQSDKGDSIVETVNEVNLEETVEETVIAETNVNEGFLENTIETSEKIIETSEIIETEINDTSESEVVLNNSYITSFDELFQSKYIYEKKPCLDSVLSDFQNKLNVTLDNKQEIEIEVVWECVQNYDLRLGDYEFSPIIEEYTIAENVELPVISVHVEDEEDGQTFETRDFLNEMETPIPVKEYSRKNRYCARALPSKYDGYAENSYLPAIRDQGSEGTCWVFGNLGAVETDLIKKGICDRDIELSVLQMAYFTAYMPTDYKNCRNGDRITVRSGVDYLNNGGNAEIMYRNLFFNIGPVEEELMPYELGNTYVPDEDLSSNYNYAGVKNVYKINLDDRENIKQAIYEHGSVVAAFFAAEGTFNDGSRDEPVMREVAYSATYNSFYGTFPHCNHMITLVGWDDNFPKENYATKEKPKHDGAWLIRNSWGLDDYGKSGYFWISYEDAGLYSMGCVYAYDMEKETYDNVYGYDGQYIEDEYIQLSKDELLEEDFLIDDGEKIEAIGIELNTANAHVDFTLSNGEKTVSVSGDTTFAGFYTFQLQEPVIVDKKEKYHLKVKTSSLYEDQVTLLAESLSKIHYGCLTLEASNEGNATINGKNITRDPRIRIYTNTVVEKKTIDFKKSFFEEHAGETIQLELGDETYDASKFEWKSLNTKCATVTDTGLVTVGCKKGTAKIVAKSDFYGVEAVCTIKVKPYQIHYALDADTISLIKIHEYYPGDATNSEIPDSMYNSVYKKGYSFEGWFLDEEHSKYIYGSIENQTGDVTLYPSWNPVDLEVAISSKHIKGLESYADEHFSSTIISPRDMPVNLEGNPEMYEYGVELARKYKEDNPDKEVEFIGFAKDPEGKQLIGKITTDEYQLVYESFRSNYQRYRMDASLVLYPQFKIESQKAEHKLKNEYIKQHAGTKVQLVFNDADVKISDFEWKSDNTSIATVTKEGLVTVGCYKGATYITGTSKINSEIVKCYVTVDPYKIAYILDEDVISEIQDYQRVYYPGDMDHCKLPNGYYPFTDSVYKCKKRLEGWYRTEGLEDKITQTDLYYMNEDICLYPIWEDIDIYLEVLPISNVTNVYSIPYEERLELRLSQSELPFDIMSSQEVTTFMKQSVEKYNQENPDHMIEFLYFSDDREGKNLITEITDEFIELRKSTATNGKDYYWNINTKYLIPQYRELQNTKAKVLGTQMILRGKLEMKYDVVFSEASKDKLDEMIVVFKCDNREERRKLTECGSIVDESMNEYYLSTLVNVTEIDQEIELSFEDRNGNCITIENANDGMSFRMSAFEYLNQFINGQYDIYNQTHQVVTFISIYGLYAQRYFGKANTDDYEAKIKKLIGDESWDSFVDLIDKVSYEDIAEQKYKVIGKSKNVSYYGSSLLLKSGTTIRHYFNVTDANSIKNIKFYCDGVEITPHVYGEMYYVEVEDISPADFHRMFKIEVDGIQIQYGVNSYLYSALKSKHTSEKMVSLAKVMYLYGKNCRKY